MSKSLKGLRVVDLSHVLAAPTCTMFLADLGAEVIHIEPPDGDDSRAFGPFVNEPDKNQCGYFISLNRNKKSMVLDLKHNKGKKILRELIKVSDVIVENYRPDTMKKLGFDWQEITKINPRIIYASISGFGRDTLPEYTNRPAYDMVAQGYSGIMSITGPEDGPLCRVGTSIGDIVAGHQAVIGILSALLWREKTGKGQYYDGSMVDGLFAILENAVARYGIEGVIPEPLGSAHPSITPFQGFKTHDGWIIMPVGNDKLWKKFCEAIDRADLISHQYFKTNPDRTKNRKKLIPILEIEIEKKTTKEWSDILDRKSLPYSQINNIKEVYESKHIQYRKMLVEIEQPGAGKMKIVGSPIKLSETPGEVYAPAPLLGQHSEEIMSEILGYSTEEITIMKNKGVINK
ncbi:MAG: CaiB/BaiF CoA-transferase family protein [Thermodesulfobacteriota bacterium]|nr:CaiB/BaiF CoA-transferase family protein [Thermodesulfobacteriota bacterium]